MYAGSHTDAQTTAHARSRDRFFDTPPKQGDIYLRWFNLGIILLATLYVGLPLLSLLIDALRGPIGETLGDLRLWQAFTNTLLIGLSAALLSVVAGWLLLQYSASLALEGRGKAARLIDLAGSIVYVVPPLVIGTGLFVLLSPHIDVFDWVYPIVIAINALMGLPFVIRCLGPAIRQNHARYHRLCLGLAFAGMEPVSLRRMAVAAPTARPSLLPW